MIPFNVEMDISNVEQITRQIKLLMVKGMERIIDKAAPKMKARFGQVIREEIMKTPEYRSITSSTGLLHSELGLLNPHAKMDAILDRLVENIKIVKDKNTLQVEYIDINMHVELGADDYSDLLNVSEASYESNEYNIPWLQWLLMGGSHTLVHNFRVMPVEYLSKSARTSSRSGLSLMIANGSWSMPEEFQGTKDNNFITRALDSEQIGQHFSKIAQEEFEKIVEEV